VLFQRASPCPASAVQEEVAKLRAARRCRAFSRLHFRHHRVGSPSIKNPARGDRCTTEEVSSLSFFWWWSLARGGRPVFQSIESCKGARFLRGFARICAGICRGICAVFGFCTVFRTKPPGFVPRKPPGFSNPLGRPPSPRYFAPIPRAFVPALVPFLRGFGLVAIRRDSV
jgi:hypothetical protein